MELLLTKTLELLISPPGLMFGLILAGILIGRRFYRTGKLLIGLGALLLILVSLPIVTTPLIQWEENIPALNPASLTQTPARAIVILGAGRYRKPPEFPHDSLGGAGLVRVHYGAWLQRQSKLPILVSGGTVYGGGDSEGAIMKRIIEQDFRGTVRWVEAQSRTTHENAVYSQTLLATEQIDTIVLVTHALHMRRAKQSFEHAGFRVIPAPISFRTNAERPWYMSIFPSADSIKASDELLHEWYGRLWYTIRYY